MPELAWTVTNSMRQLAVVAALCCGLVAGFSSDSRADSALELQALTEERLMLTRELDEYRKTLSVLQTDGTPPEQSANPAVRTLAREMVSIRERLVAITEREVTLLQEQILDSKAVASVEPPPEAAETPVQAIESKPIRTEAENYSREQEEADVARLYTLLTDYYTELQDSANTLPSAEELEQRKAALRDAQTLARIPFNADKVRLSGAEGSTALAQITRRLSDPNLPESRRDVAPICSVKTRLFGSLIASENRSLKPVGKHHFLARIRMQPGDTVLRIQEHSWQVRLPQDFNATDFLVTLYRPPGDKPELHIFSIDDLLAQKDAHIPDWLPNELRLNTGTG